MLKVENCKLIDRNERDVVLAQCASNGQARQIGKELVRIRAKTTGLVRRLYEDFNLDLRDIHRQKEFPVIAFFNPDFYEKWENQLLPVWDLDSVIQKLPVSHIKWALENQHTKRAERLARFERIYGDWDGDMGGSASDDWPPEEPLNSYGSNRSPAEQWEFED